MAGVQERARSRESGRLFVAGRLEDLPYRTRDIAPWDDFQGRFSPKLGRAQPTEGRCWGDLVEMFPWMHHAAFAHTPYVQKISFFALLPFVRNIGFENCRWGCDCLACYSVVKLVPLGDAFVRERAASQHGTARPVESRLRLSRMRNQSLSFCFLVFFWGGGDFVLPHASLPPVTARQYVAVSLS